MVRTDHSESGGKGNARRQSDFLLSPFGAAVFWTMETLLSEQGIPFSNLLMQDSSRKIGRCSVYTMGLYGLGYGKELSK